jgi:hypothetical protein
MTSTLVALLIATTIGLLVAVDCIARRGLKMSELERALGGAQREMRMHRPPLERRTTGSAPRTLVAPVVRPDPPTTGELRMWDQSVADVAPTHCDGRPAVFTHDGKLVRPATTRITPRQRAALLV